MSHHKLREDKSCQNCGNTVEEHYCPKCGQENTETRQSFHYLFTHFVEDLVHYDGSFWKTLKNLLFKPGVLTKDYLDGKRKKYVAPVKLYIFVSFFVFFAGGLVSKFMYNDNDVVKNGKTVNYGGIKITPPQEFNDSLLNTLDKKEVRKTVNLKDYDSIQLSLPEYERDKGIAKAVNRKLAGSTEKYSEKDFWVKLVDSFKSNFQTFLFLYMPVFAFCMWLFHSKKKWYFFDHGIFTLHYFSFMLIGFFFITSVFEPLSYISILQNWFFDIVFGIIAFIIFLWMFIYFFKAHRKVYGYSRTNTLFRGLFLLFINYAFFVIGIIIYGILLFFLS